jgi:hypothetical protein
MKNIAEKKKFIIILDIIYLFFFQFNINICFLKIIKFSYGYNISDF